MIRFEQEIINYLSLPSIPKKRWDGKSSFAKGVGVVKLSLGDLGYAVCTFDAEVDNEPRVIKYFATEPFYGIDEIFIVPNYMEVDMKNADLDDESKKAAELLANEVKEMVEDDDKKEIEEMEKLPEWVFDEIHNVDEAQAFLRNYNSRNHIKGKIPSNPETLKMRLLNIHSQMRNNK